MIFIDNKYTKWYYYIVTHPDKNATYTENHHIIPLSLGGSDAPENRVDLSARQHFIAHLLLTKMVNGTDASKMGFALSQMRRANKHHERYIPSSRIFEIIKKELSKAVSFQNKQLWKTSAYRESQIAKFKAYGATKVGKEAKRKAARSVSEEGKRQRNQAVTEANNQRWAKEENIKKASNTLKEQWTAFKAGVGPKMGREKQPSKPKPPKKISSGAKNSAAVICHLLKPDGIIIEVELIMNFCEKNALSYHALLQSFQQQKPYYSPGKKVSDIRRNTFGWQLLSKTPIRTVMS